MYEQKESLSDIVLLSRNYTAEQEINTCLQKNNFFLKKDKFFFIV